MRYLFNDNTYGYSQCLYEISDDVENSDLARLQEALADHGTAFRIIHAPDVFQGQQLSYADIVDLIESQETHVQGLLPKEID